jgi:hypothetical protein
MLSVALGVTNLDKRTLWDAFGNPREDGGSATRFADDAAGQKDSRNALGA